jgi:hypothetical protein
MLTPSPPQERSTQPTETDDGSRINATSVVIPIYNSEAIRVPNRDKVFIASSVAIVLVFALMALYHLNQCYFWQDEAYVAFMASNYVKTGHLSCWNGRNLYAALHGSLLRNDLTMPALVSFDVGSVIVSFKILGISTWTARFPSVLFAISGLVAFWAVLRLEFPKNRSLILFALGLLAFSVQYLLNARTCRYYAYASFFSILLFYCYRRFNSTHSLRYSIGIAITAALLFYSHLLGGISFILALLAVHILFHRRAFTASDWVKIGLAGAIFLAAALPYISANQLWSYGRGSPGSQGLAGLRTHLWLVWLNIRDINITNCLPWTCAVGATALLTLNRAQVDVKPITKPIAEWGALVLFYVIILALLCAPSQVSMQVATSRYYAPILPFMCGISAAFVWMVYRISRPAAVALALVLVFTNILTLTPFPYAIVPGTDQPRSLLGAFIGEITHPYPTADAVVCKYLRREAHPNDVVANLPSYHAITMDVYAGALVHTGALLDGRCHVNKQIIHALHTPLYVDETFPDWIVFYGLSQNEGRHLLSTLQYYSRPHIVNGRPVSSHYELAKVFDIDWMETNRSELLFHSFGPPKVTDPNDAVYIYHIRK